MKDPDTVIGTVAAAGGTAAAAGVTLHIVTQALSLAVLAINLALAIGGLWLLRLRMKKAARDLDGPPGAGESGGGRP